MVLVLPQGRLFIQKSPLNLSDVDDRTVAFACMLQTGEESSGSVKRCDAGGTGFHRIAADEETVPILFADVGGGVDDQIGLTLQNHIQDIGSTLFDFMDRSGFYTMLI